MASRGTVEPTKDGLKLGLNIAYWAGGLNQRRPVRFHGLSIISK